MTNEIVRGGCPACHRGGLALGPEGHIYCMHEDCLDVRAADRLLRLGTTGWGSLPERLEAKIKDAYYDERDQGGTMDSAAVRATEAVVAIFLAERERIAVRVEELPGHDGEALTRWPSRHAEIYQLAIEEAAARVRADDA